MKKGKKVLFLVISIVTVLIVSTTAMAGGDGITDFRDYYVPRPCEKCDTGFDSSQTDSYGHSRQYGIKLCKKLLFVTFRVATFLKIFNPTLCPNRQISHCY